MQDRSIKTKNNHKTRNMKKILLLLAIILPFLLTGCSGENSPIEELPTPPVDPKEYIVSFGFSGEITNIEESPLSRAVGNDLYGIQVYSMPAAENDASKYKPYAYGLFDDKAGMTVKLLEGYKYKFVSTMVVNGKNVVYSYSGGYSDPFYSGSSTPVGNSFSYSSDKMLGGLRSGYTTMANTKSAYIPNVERYYGELTAYIPVESKPVSINMKRVSFGVKVITEGFTEGKITISLKKGASIYIVHPDTEVTDMFTFQNANLYLDPISWTKDDYTETISVSMTWEKTDGAVTPLINQDITFKRNKLTTVTIKVKDSSINNGVDISNEDTPMGDGGNITIDAGNGTDTGVTPTP